MTCAKRLGCQVPLPLLALVAGLVAMDRPAAAEVTALGSFGRGVITWPRGMAMDPRGQLFVGDYLDGLDVHVFTQDGASLGSFGGPLLERPAGIALDGDGNIYVSDFDGHHVDVFDALRRHLGSFGQGMLDNPAGITFDSQGRIYVADMQGSHVDVFDALGSHLSSFGEEEILRPTLFAFDAQERIYVTDRYYGQVDVFDRDFQYVTTFGDADLIGATGIAIDAGGRIHVADLEGNEIDVFDRDFVHLGSYGTPQLNGPTGVVLRPSGRIWVADTLDDEIERFFDSEAWSAGHNAFPNARVGSAPLTGDTVGLGQLLELSDGRTLEVDGQLMVDGELVVAGDRLEVDVLELGPQALVRLEGALDVAGHIQLEPGARLIAQRMEVVLGPATTLGGGGRFESEDGTRFDVTAARFVADGVFATAEIAADLKLGDAEIEVAAGIVGPLAVYDRFRVEPGARLDLRGSLALSLADGAPAPGTRLFVVEVDAGGELAHEAFPGLVDDPRFELDSLGADGLVVVYVPEPDRSAAAIAALGAAVALAARRGRFRDFRLQAPRSRSWVTRSAAAPTAASARTG